MDEYADVYKDLRLVVCSEKRRALLLSLNEGEKPIANLQEELKTSSATLVHASREMEESRLVRQDRTRQYRLTPAGRSTARKVIDIRRAMEVLKKHDAFWSEHDLSGIPDHIFDRVGSLRDATLVTGTPPNVFKAMRRFVELLQDSTVVRLVSPIYIPEIGAIVLEKFESDNRIKLVLTEPVLRHLIGDALPARLNEERGKRLTLRVLRDDPKLVMVITDRLVALALYHPFNSFDYSSVLTSENPEAIAWGQQLFDHYVSVSADVVL